MAPLNDGQEIPLWPGTAPGSDGLHVQEAVTSRGPDPAHPDRCVTGISRPSLTAFVPEQPHAAALIVAPGGGYVREAIDKEGTDIARRFRSWGLTVFVLKYRLPCEGHQQAVNVPLQDAQRAVRLVRAHAAEWRLDPARIIFMGFSAAGHMASTLATRFADPVYPIIDETDTVSARPDALVLGYPVISMEDGVAHPGTRAALLGPSPDRASQAAASTDHRVTKESPPTFLFLASDDAVVPPEHGLRYYRALLHAGVPAELHVYAQGKHGFALRTAALPAAAWPRTLWAWLASLGMVPRAK